MADPDGERDLRQRGGDHGIHRAAAALEGLEPDLGGHDAAGAGDRAVLTHELHLADAVIGRTGGRVEVLLEFRLVPETGLSTCGPAQAADRTKAMMLTTAEIVFFMLLLL